MSGNKNDEECIEMDDEIYEIMVIYCLYEPSLLYFGDILVNVKI